MVPIPQTERAYRSSKRTALRTVVNFVAIAGSIAIVLAHMVLPDVVAVSFYGVLVIGYVTSKIVLAELYRAQFARMPRRDTSNLSVDVAIAFFNEVPELIEAGIKSGLAQDGILVGRVIAVDDGSRSPETSRYLEHVFRDEPRVLVIRYESNIGKRHALGVAFEHIISPYAALMDSDTVLESTALANLVSRMEDRTAVVTANIRALNRDDNWLSRIIDARYRNAFMIERAAQSAMGSALCASGVLSVYRSNFLRAVKDEWISQRFLAKPVQFGDDRRLTALAMQRGRAIIALDAVAFTMVPTDPVQFVKQQLRWNKSFLRESALAVRDFSVLSVPGFLSFLELFFWFFYLSTIANLLIFNPVVGTWSIMVIWLAYVIATGLFRNLSLIVREPRLVLLVPLYSLAHVLILTPLRLFALVTILDTRWGTR